MTTTRPAPPGKPTVPQVLPLVYAYRSSGPPANRVGGSLHAVLDEGNVADRDVARCLEYARGQGDEAGAALAGVLSRMSRTQRRKLAALFYGGPR
jgi:hypothetical protein